MRISPKDLHYLKDLPVDFVDFSLVRRATRGDARRVRLLMRRLGAFQCGPLYVIERARLIAYLESVIVKVA